MSVLLVTVLAAPVDAQKRFDETTSVVVVEVPVQVTRDGQPLRGLTAEDFEVLDGRKKQEIVGFDVLDLTLSGSVDAIDLPVAARRHFLLLFDLSFSNPTSIVRARLAALDLVRDDLHPSDLVAVGTYSARNGARVVVGFTSDRRQVALALDSLGLPQLVDGVRDPLGLILEDAATLDRTASLDRIGEPDPGGQGAIQRAGVDPGAEIRDILTTIDREARRDASNNQVLALASAMTEFATLLNSVNGRKQIVYLSEGFDSSQMVGLGVGRGDQERTQEVNEAAMSGEYWRVKSDERFGSTSTLNELEEMVRQFVNSDCTIHAVDIGGLRTEGEASARGQHGLSYLASSTGGEFYRNFNDLSGAMEKMLERNSVTYVLAIQPKNLAADGRFRRLKVRLKDGSKGVRLTHRPGYFAPKPYRQRTAEERRLITAGLIMGGREGGEIATSILAAPFASGGDRAYVPVLIEVEGLSLLAGTEDRVLPAEVYAYAVDSNGGVIDYFTRVFGLDLDQLEAKLSQTGFKYWGHFELPPGDYTVRVLVRNGLAGTTGLRVAKVKVPDQTETVLLPPMFPEPAGKWILGREKDAGADTFEYPFLMAGEPFVPAARPVVRVGEVTRISLVSYNLGSQPDGATVEVRDGQGTRVDGGNLTFEGSATGLGSGPERWVASFRCPEGLAPGNYDLVVRLAGEESSIPISIGS